MSERERVSVPIGGERLRADRWRGDGPPLVFLHAGVADRRSWYELTEQLDGREMVAYDRRGFGESPVPSGRFSHLEDLVAVLGELTSEPAWLVGSSIGGGLAIDAALAAPDTVAGIVLFAPAVSGAPEWELDAVTEAIGELAETAEKAGDEGEVNRLETWIWLDGPAGPEGRVTGAARRLFSAMNRVVLANSVPEEAGASGLDAWSRLHEIDVPAVVACGDLDVPFLVERSRQLVERLPRASYRELTGTAHLPYLERPGAAAEIVREAVAGLD